MFEVLLLRASALFDGATKTMVMLDGSIYCRRDGTSAAVDNGSGTFLVDSMFDYVERFNGMCLVDSDVAVYSAVVLVAPDRPGVRNPDLVDRIQQRLKSILGKVLRANHPSDHNSLYGQLMLKMADLRTLNTLHQEKLLSFRIAASANSEHSNGV